MLWLDCDISHDIISNRNVPLTFQAVSIRLAEPLWLALNWNCATGNSPQASGFIRLAKSNGE